VLLDIGMPDGDGYEVARRIRAAQDGYKPFLVALTGWEAPRTSNARATPAPTPSW
jgi:two-component system, chemotaxis family, CheB/CheR fusion protein